MEFNLYGLLMSQVEWIGGGSSEEVKAAAKTWNGFKFIRLLPIGNLPLHLVKPTRLKLQFTNWPLEAGSKRESIP